MQLTLDFRAPSTELERFGARLGEGCWFGETGIGWLGTHHCWKCYLLAEFDCDWDLYV